MLGRVFRSLSVLKEPCKTLFDTRPYGIPTINFKVEIDIFTRIRKIKLNKQSYATKIVKFYTLILIVFSFMKRVINSMTMPFGKMINKRVNHTL